MTVLVETKTETTATTSKADTTKTAKKTRKPIVKRGYNALGKFFQKIRIDLDMTSAQWAKEIKVSPLTLADIERGDKPLSFEIALAIANLIQEKAPEYETDYAVIVAETLKVLLIPAKASAQAVESAYMTLQYFDKQMAEQPQPTE